MFKKKHRYTYNISELSKMFGLSRNTVRKRLQLKNIIPHEKLNGAPVYVLFDAAKAIVYFELELEKTRQRL